MRRPVLLALLAGSMLAACSIPDIFTCATNAQCTRAGETGRCEPESACSFPDPTCQGGYRFAAYAPAGLSGDCVPDRTTPDGPVVSADGPDGPTGDVEANAPVVADTTLDSAVKTANFGAATELRVDAAAVSLVRFDLAPVGSGTVVTAELHVWTTATGGLDRGQVAVFAVLEAWDEGTDTGQDGVASWNQRRAGTDWTDPGAGAPDSRAATLLGQAQAVADASEAVIALSPAVVNGWMAEPTTNFGLALVGVDTFSRHLILVSREGQSGHAPVLHVRIRRSP